MGKWLEAAQVIREQIEEKDRQIIEFRDLADRWKELAEMTNWFEVDLGSSFVSGQKIRYLLKTYECIKDHSKSLTRSPLNSTYWKEID